MYAVWYDEKKSKEQAKEVIQSLISANVEAIYAVTFEFIDEACNGDELLKSLDDLRTKRNHLFDVLEDLEADIAWLSESMAEVVDTEFPDGLPEEFK